MKLKSLILIIANIWMLVALISDVHYITKYAMLITGIVFAMLFCRIPDKVQA